MKHAFLDDCASLNIINDLDARSVMSEGNGCALFGSRRTKSPRQHLPHAMSLPEDAVGPPQGNVRSPQQPHSITVLLPSHSYSLTISDLSGDATVGDLKSAISDQCPGRPAISGQRIIVQGKVLKDEAKLVESTSSSL